MLQTIRIKRIVSLTALLSFVLVVLNSVALYISPHGRVAYWVDWHFLGLSKTQWADQHIIVGLLFLIALILHIYYNWNPIVAYLKSKAKKIKVFTPDFNIALALAVIFTIGAHAQIAPFKWVIDFSEAIKENVAEKQGEPPYGRAETSTLKTFADKTGLDLNDSLARLKQAGVKADDPEQTLLELARQNQRSPQILYQFMQPEELPGHTEMLPPDPPKDFGKKTLSQICRQYGLDTTAVTAALKIRGINVSPDSSIKQIAEQQGISPDAIYEALQNIAAEPHRKKSAD
jgi:hypothetical protein